MGWATQEMAEEWYRKGLLTYEECYGKSKVPEPAPEAPGRNKCRKIDPAEFKATCERHGLPVPIREHYFCDGREWRLDWAWLEQKVALEIDGGAGWGRHTRKDGFIKDQEKRNEAILLGWRVFHCVPEDVRTENVFYLLKRALEVK